MGLYKNLKDLPHFPDKNKEKMKQYVKELSNNDLRTINSMPANCPPHGWPVRKHEDLVNLLHFAEAMNSGRTQFRPTPSCDKCDGTGKRTVPTKMIKSAKHAKGLEGL